MSTEGGGAAPDGLPPGKVVSLTVIRGPDAGIEYRFERGRVTIGRKRGDLLLSDRETSGIHASVEALAEGGFVLKDLGSTNGTWLDGKRVTIAELVSGQQIRCGANSLLFTVAEAGEADDTLHLDVARPGEDAPDRLSHEVPSAPVSMVVGPAAHQQGGLLLGDEFASPAGGNAMDAPDLGDVDLSHAPGVVEVVEVSAPPGERPVAAPFEELDPMPLPPGPLAAPNPFAEPIADVVGAVPGVAPAARHGLTGAGERRAAEPTEPGPPTEADGAHVDAGGHEPQVSPTARTTQIRAPSWDVPGVLSEASGPIALRSMPEARPGPPAEPSARVSGASSLLSGQAAHAAEAPVGDLPMGVERSPFGLYLLIERGKDRGRVFPLIRQVTVVGRSETDVVLNDADVSRRHAALDVQAGGKVLVRDLKSTNGTLLNGIRVTSENVLNNDKLRIGGTTLKLVVGDARVAGELRKVVG